jgi:hypothetical protein
MPVDQKNLPKRSLQMLRTAAYTIRAGRLPDPQSWTAQDWRIFLENLGMVVMQNTCHSDVALMQHRDVFLPSTYVESAGRLFQPYGERGIQALLDIIFWKGDYIQCIDLPGSTIQSLLQTSEQLQEQEDLGLATELSQGWALASLGVTQETKEPKITGQDLDQKKNNLLINGQYLDPKKLYSVAITDYLANGDTGYPALQNAEPYPAAAWNRLAIRPLSYTLMNSLFPKSDIPREPKPDEILDALLWDTSPVPKKPSQPGAGAWFANLKSINKRASISDLDKAGRDPPRFSVNLYKLDGNYSLFAHNGSLASVGEKFPGVSAVDLSSPDSLSYGFDHLARFQYDRKRWQLFSQSELNYGDLNRRGKPPNEAYQPSQSADYYSIQLGGAFRLYPRFREPAVLTFQLPLELDTQVLRPLTQVSIIQQPCPQSEPKCTKASPGASPPPVYAARNRYYSYRPGFRYVFSFLRPQPPGQSSGQGQVGAQGQGQGKGQSSQAGGGGGAGQGGAKGQGSSQNSTLDSYVEFGYANGRLRNGPSAFMFSYQEAVPAGTTPPPPGQITCGVDNLLTCIAPLEAPNYSAHLTGVVPGRSHSQQGIYLNFRVDMPLWNYSEFVMENLGNLYFNKHGDAVVDVRYWDDLKFSLNVPVFPKYPKITLAPTYEVMWFKNKVIDNFYASQAAYISLNYTFGWHSGLSWRKVLEGYSDPVPTLPPLPTR